ncbi:phage tail protein [Sphingomonas sp. 3-13AW]|uniref:phage tail protein n=1 Tax=Sphingomonas sp. 3-13AW TaxID=3050450 RepID=UPI003BB4BEC2
MSGTLGKVAMVAGMVALAATGAGAIAGAGWGIAGVGSFSAIAQAASVAAVAASTAASMTVKKPTAQGSSTDITIGANMPSPMILGESYYGGSRVHLVGYGSENDVPNSYLWAVDVYGVGGPYEALVGTYMDFTPVSFGGTGQALGYYSNNVLYRDYQLGLTPEPDALVPHWPGAPNWGAAYKLSGKAAIGWNARFPKDGKRFGSGFPQTGAVWRGIKLYDPRLDSTFPGGAGSQRWADPANRSAFAAAKATWIYSRNPGLHALRYALGTWERDESNTAAEYKKTFGIGLSLDGIIIEDFIHLANVCDDNGWTCNGVISEPGDKWANLKSILQAGGAEPCFRNGQLGLRINAPRVALDTITVDDLADGENVFPAMQSYRDRLNTIIPKYREPAQKWEYVATQEPVQVTQFVTEDGEEKSAERQYNLVTNPNQAAQLAGYDLIGGREVGPVELVCKPRLRKYGPGDMLTLNIPEAGEMFTDRDFVIINRTVDPATMTVSLTLVSENPNKHAFALGLTGNSPPAIRIPGPDEADDVAGSRRNERAAHRLVAQAVPYPLNSTADAIAITAMAGNVMDDGRIIDLPDGSLPGLTAGTQYGVFWNLTAGFYETYPSPAAAAMAANDNIFLGWVTTANADGTYPAAPTPPGGWGGNGSSGGGYQPQMPDA